MRLAGSAGGIIDRAFGAGQGLLFVGRAGGEGQRRREEKGQHGKFEFHLVSFRGWDAGRIA